jgi:hypothetical protein
MKKRLFAILAVCALLLTLFGCTGRGHNKSKPSPKPSTTPQITASPTPVTVTPTAKPKFNPRTRNGWNYNFGRDGRTGPYHARSKPRTSPRVNPVPRNAVPRVRHLEEPQ